MRFFRSFHPFLWLTASGALLLLTLVEILKPGAFFWDDNLVQFFPWYEFNYYALLQHGALPQINFYTYLGHPYLSSDQPGVFYPPIYLGMALGHAAGRPELGLEWIIWVHLIAAALVVEKIMRQWLAPPFLALGGAWLYLTIPFNLCSAEIWVMNSYTLFYVALIFFLLERLLQAPSFYRVTLLALAKVFFLFSGHINYYALSLIFESAYLLVRLVWIDTGPTPSLELKKRWFFFTQGFFLWISANFLAFLLSLPALGPVLDHLTEYAERSQSYPLSTILAWSLHPFVFLSAQVGFFRNDFWNNYSFRPGWMFLGGSIFLLILPLAGWQKTQVRRWGTMTLIAIIFSTSAYALIAFLPGYHSFRWPMKNLLFVGFFYPLFFISFLNAAQRRWKSSVVFIVLFLAIISNLCVVVSSAGANGAERFPRYPVTFHFPPDRLQDGRSFLAAVGMSEFFDPDYLTLNFATLARVPILAGYDPLVLKQNKREALNTVFLGLCDHPLDATLMPHLDAWSVRYYFVHEPSPAGNFLHSLPQVHEIYRRGHLHILENSLAAPLAYFEDTPQHALPLHFGVNEVTVDTSSHPSEGTVSLSLVPLPGYTWSLSGQAFRAVPVAPAGRMRIPEVKGGGTLRLVYQEPALPLFLIVSFLTFLALACGISFEKIQRRCSSRTSSTRTPAGVARISLGQDSFWQAYLWGQGGTCPKSVQG